MSDDLKTPKGIDELIDLIDKRIHLKPYDRLVVPGLTWTDTKLFDFCYKDLTTQQKKIDELEKERDIWKSQLIYIKDKHRELHEQEMQCEENGIEYTGQIFDNSVICVWEVAVAEVEALEKEAK